MNKPRPLDLNDTPEEDGIVRDPTVASIGKRRGDGGATARGARAYAPPEDESGTLMEERGDDWGE